MIASKGEAITPEEMRDFLRVLKLWVKYRKGYELANDFTAYARDAWDTGLVSLSPASTRMIANRQNEY